MRRFIAIALSAVCISSTADAQRAKPFTEDEKEFQSAGAYVSCRSLAKPPAEGFLYEITNEEMTKSATKDIPVSLAYYPSSLAYYILTETHPNDLSKIKNVAVLDAWLVNFDHVPSSPLGSLYALPLSSPVMAKDLKVAGTHGNYGRAAYGALTLKLYGAGISCRRADSLLTKSGPKPPPPPVYAPSPAQVKYDDETRNMWIGMCMKDGNKASACGCFHDRLKQKLIPFHWARWGKLVRQSPSVIIEPFARNSEWTLSDHTTFNNQLVAAFPACGVKPRR